MHSEKLKYLWSLAKWDGKSSFGINSIKGLLEHLGNPQDKVPSIHVAGTNGKGSTSVMIAAGLGAAGYKVGLTISPHLERLTERFVIDGEEVSEDWIEKYSQIIEKACIEKNLRLTFHEALIAIAFVGFSDSNLDFMVVEVGLGGRLDATNVLSNPLATIITSIGLDHQEVLGNTEELIAAEKAGIAKSNTRMYVGEIKDSVYSVISSICENIHSPILRFNKDFFIEHDESELSLKGDHQRINASVASKVLADLGVSKSHIDFGLLHCFWAGRLENVEVKGHKLLIDCAHNSHGTSALIQYLDQNTLGKITLIYGTLDLKDWDKSLKLLLPYVDKLFYLKPFSERALAGSTIVEFIQKSDFNHVEVIDMESDSMQMINYINMLSCNQLILLTGSIYLVGKLRSLLDIPIQPLWRRCLVEQ